MMHIDQTMSGFKRQPSSPSELLLGNEVVAIVDDDASIRESLQQYFSENGLATECAASAGECFQLLERRNVALVLLDIGLPDIDGFTLLPQLVEKYPDLWIIMLTGVADLQVALDCLRKGADDYLSKPVQMKEILFTVRKTLDRRRLIFQNRQYQEDLENANFRIQLMHQLSLKMNNVYLNTVALDEILHAILVGITANEGLRFNRAFLAMVDDRDEMLKGRLAIGPDCQEEAGRIWRELRDKQLDFLDIVHDLRERCNEGSEVNRIVQALCIPLADTNNILIKSAVERRSIKVSGGHAPDCDPSELVKLLGVDSFVVVPLYSLRRYLGVIIADNFVTGRPISDSYVSALELFSSQASLAIEHSHLYVEMEGKIAELEELNHELDKNKDMLVQAERYSALGQMAAQMVHNIRNPITSIGGVSRILAKKIDNEEYEKYLNVMVKETARLETTLAELYEFVTQVELRKERTLLFPLLKKVLMLVQTAINKQGIAVELSAYDPELALDLDPTQVSQLFLHLVKNGVEAMPDGGSLGVTITGDEDWVVVAIKNSVRAPLGVPGERGHDPFFTTKTYGTGMGLTMVERVVKAHGGELKLRNSEEGMEVLVKLPYRGAA